MIRDFTQQQSDGTWETGAFCLLAHKEYNQNNQSMVMVDSWHGLVIAEFEKNFRDDSDFYAVVWDEAIQAPRKILYATTRAWSYPCSCVVDASQEVIAEFEAFKANERAKSEERRRQMERYVPKVGMVARSTTTRGKAKGKQGEITWIGDSDYSREKLVRIGGVYVEVPKIELWDEETEEWLKPARYSRTFRCWVVS